MIRMRTRMNTQILCVIRVYIVPHHYNYPAVDILEGRIVR